MYFFSWIGLAFAAVVGAMAYRRQRTRFRRGVPGALGFAVLAFLFALPALIWWTIVDWKLGRAERTLS